MSISCIAIDDEPIALEVIKTLAAKIPFIALKETFLSPVKALAFLQKEPVDLVFLDIQMPDVSGVEIAHLIGDQAKIIFTTAFPDYAIKGFELDVVDYLLKPIQFDRFLQACKRVKDLLNNGATVNQEQGFFIKNGYELVKIHFHTLLFVEANDNYLIFQEQHKKTMTRMTLHEAEARLPVDLFLRIHKSFIVNFLKIEKVEKHQVTLAGKTIPLSSFYQKALFEKLGI